MGESNDREKEEGGAVGGESIWSESRLGGRAAVGDIGRDKGTVGEVGISRDMRLVVDTAIPAFCKERMRSAMLPPPVCTTALSASSSALDDLQNKR